MLLPTLFALLLLCLPAARADTVTVTLLATTDLHGNIYPWDYYTAKPAERGLAKIATLVERERARNPYTLLIDGGDTIQGAPIASVYQTYARTGALPLGLRFPAPAPTIDPMALVMNHLRYDAMVVGNHEYNYGLKNFEAARHASRFPWLSANTAVAPGTPVKPFDPYVVKTVGGVKVAVIGITTPAIPQWEKPEHYAGLRFLPGVDAARQALARLRAGERPDAVILGVHAGVDRDLKTGAVRPGETGEENMVYQLATQVAGVDAIVYGHTHQEVASHTVNGVLLMQPKNWGISLGAIDLTFVREGGRWRLTAKQSRLIPVTRDTPAGPRVLALAKPYHEVTERFLDMPVAESPAALDGALGRIEDSALLDAVQTVQLHYTKADVSMTALFNPRVSVPSGPVSVRQIAALYIYDNELYLVEGNGKMLREALENAARYFLSCRDEACAGPLVNKNVMGFNFDIAQGVEYEIDLTRPEGSRVRGLRFRGRPLADAQPLKIAINNYRAGGSGGYTMFRNAKVLWRSNEEIRDMIVRYYTEKKRLPDAADHNWRIVPEAARASLEREVRAGAGRPSSY